MRNNLCYFYKRQSSEVKPVGGHLCNHNIFIIFFVRMQHFKKSALHILVINNATFKIKQVTLFQTDSVIDKYTKQNKLIIDSHGIYLYPTCHMYLYYKNSNTIVQCTKFVQHWKFNEKSIPVPPSTSLNTYLRQLLLHLSNHYNYNFVACNFIILLSLCLDLPITNFLS